MSLTCLFSTHLSFSDVMAKPSSRFFNSISSSWLLLSASCLFGGTCEGALLRWCGDWCCSLHKCRSLSAGVFERALTGWEFAVVVVTAKCKLGTELILVICRSTSKWTLASLRFCMEDEWLLWTWSGCWVSIAAAAGILGVAKTLGGSNCISIVVGTVERVAADFGCWKASPVFETSTESRRKAGLRGGALTWDILSLLTTGAQLTSPYLSRASSVTFTGTRLLTRLGALYAERCWLPPAHRPLHLDRQMWKYLKAISALSIA